jgi:adenylate kinase family enzyme
MKILVVGTAGSGKTTTATELARRLAVPHVELDAMFWGPDWSQPDRAEFRDRVQRTLAGCDRWVVDGNYRSVRELVACQADLVVWLDYPLVRTQWRLLRRTTTRLLRREVLWNGNRESVRKLLGSRLEFFRWASLEHRRLRTEIPELCASRSSGTWTRVRNRGDLQELYVRLDAMESSG